MIFGAFLLACLAGVWAAGGSRAPAAPLAASPLADGALAPVIGVAGTIGLVAALIGVAESSDAMARGLGFAAVVLAMAAGAGGLCMACRPPADPQPPQDEGE